MMDLSGKAITDTYPYRSLCGRRLDNAFPFASSSGGHTRTCFEDVVLVPLASWLFYLALLVALVLAIRASPSSGKGSGASPLHRLIHRRRQAPTSALEQNGKPTWTARWPRLATTLSIIYSFLLIAALLMNVLEVVRLYLADRGAGLLPFTLASLVIVLVALHVPLASRYQLPVNVAILVFWTFSLVFESVKLATLNSLQTIEPRAKTEYLNSDQQIDVGVIIGLYAIMWIGELVRVVRIRRQQEQSDNLGTAAAYQRNDDESKL